LEFNLYEYASSNPTNYTDPTGYISEDEDDEAKSILADLKKYNITIYKDWFDPSENPLHSSFPRRDDSCTWVEGRWSLLELKIVKFAIKSIYYYAMKGQNNSLIEPIMIKKTPASCGRGCAPNLPTRDLIELNDYSKLPTEENMVLNIINEDINFDAFTIAHEVGHVWDFQHEGKYHRELMRRTKGKIRNLSGTNYCKQDIQSGMYRLPGCNSGSYYFGGVPLYGGGNTFNPLEDFANSFAVYVFPSKAQSIIEERYNTNDPKSKWYPYYSYNKYYYWTYNDLYKNPRWKYIDDLIEGRAK
jgi:hypothetical protein